MTPRASAARLICLSTLFIACAAQTSSTANKPQSVSYVAEPNNAAPKPSFTTPSKSAVLPTASMDLLRDLEVDDNRFARDVLYTWTTPDKADTALRSKALLTIHDSPEFGLSQFDSRLLQHGALQLEDAHVSRWFQEIRGLYFRRYSWSAPWATRLPLGPVSYGDRLIRMKLRSNAIVGRFDPSSEHAWSFQDLQGKAVPLDRALRERDKIAAVVHIKWKVSSKRFELTPRGETFVPVRTGYREVVVVNESMIEEWSMGTAEILDELKREAKTLRALAATFGELGDPGQTAAWSQLDFTGLWAKPRSESLVEAYGRALAFPMVDGYSPTRAHLEAIAASLEATLDQGREARVSPKIVFDGGAAPPPMVVDRIPPENPLLLDLSMIQKVDRERAMQRVASERTAPGCLLCALLNGGAGPKFTLFEDDTIVVALSRYALRPGHVLVIPRAHHTSLSSTPDSLWIHCTCVAKLAGEAVERALNPVRVYVASLGATSEDVLISTPHLHLHVIPITEPDVRPHQVLTWANGVYVGEDDDWAALRDELSAAFESHRISPTDRE
ncbi:MAG: HIT family protein [Polyangiaceae bacterium]